MNEKTLPDPKLQTTVLFPKNLQIWLNLNLLYLSYFQRLWQGKDIYPKCGIFAFNLNTI